MGHIFFSSKIITFDSRHLLYILVQLHFNLTLDRSCDTGTQTVQVLVIFTPKCRYNMVTQTFSPQSVSWNSLFLFVTAEMLSSECFYPAITHCSLFALLCCLCILRSVRAFSLMQGSNRIWWSCSAQSLIYLCIFLYIWTTNVLYSTSWWK